MEKETNILTQELYISAIQKYSNEKDKEKKNNTVHIIALGFFILGTISSIVSGYLTVQDISAPTNLVLGHIFTTFTLTGLSFSFLIKVIKGIAKQTGLEIRIEEIRELFIEHGLILDDEVSKGRSI